LKSSRVYFDFILKEWLLFASAVGLGVTSVYTKQLPVFSGNEQQVIFILAVLFISVKGLEQSGLILWLSRSLEKGRFVPVKLVVITFFLSMLVTNDVALIVLVPLTLVLKINRKGILVILEALAANAGSALTPVGNPQNLFIYWTYSIRPDTFILNIFPFSIFFLLILVAGSSFIKVSSKTGLFTESVKIKSTAYIYSAFLVILILIVLHVLPVYLGWFVLVYAIIFDRSSLKIDYFLLLTFVFFFGLAGNLKGLFPLNIENPDHVFVFSALVSQLISNVPATLLFSKLTSQWQALLWGANVGGFGSLVASMANLIAYKLYINHLSVKDKLFSFTLKFIVFGYVAFFLGLSLFFILKV